MILTQLCPRRGLRLVGIGILAGVSEKSGRARCLFSHHVCTIFRKCPGPMARECAKKLARGSYRVRPSPHRSVELLSFNSRTSSVLEVAFRALGPPGCMYSFK